MRQFLKRWPVLLALLVAVGAVVVGLICLPYGSRVTRANCGRIQKGMTEAEVRAILGKPWENSLFDPDGLSATEFGVINNFHGERNKVGVRAKYWFGNGLVVFVFFDSDDRVAPARFLIGDADPQRTALPNGVWRRLRARLGW